MSSLLGYRYACLKGTAGVTEPERFGDAGLLPKPVIKFLTSFHQKIIERKYS